MRTFRKERVGSLIQEELGRELLREVEFPEGALATITGVVVSDDLEHAKVWLSVLPGELAEAALKVAKGARSELQYRLLKKINIKPMPRIEFALDRGPELAAAVEKMLLDEDNE